MSASPEIQAEINGLNFKVLDFVHIAPVPPSTEVRRGVCRFVGATEFSEGVWVGVELVGTAGKNSGTVRDVKYFQCHEGQGVFVRPELVTPFGENIESVAAAIATVVQQKTPVESPVTAVSPPPPPVASPPPVPAVPSMSADPKKNLSGHTELELLGSIEELKETINELKSELGSVKSKLEEAEADLELATEEKLYFEEQVQDLSVQLQLGEGGSGDTAAIILSYQQKVDTLSNENAKLHGQVSSLKDDLAAATDTNNQDDVVEQLTSKNLELEEQLEIAKDAAEKLSADVTALNEINLVLEEEVDESRKELEDLQDRLAAMQERCDNVAGDAAQAKLVEQLRKMGEDLRQVQMQLTTRKMNDASATSRIARDEHTAAVALRHLSSTLASNRGPAATDAICQRGAEVFSPVAAADVNRVVTSSDVDEHSDRYALLTSHAADVSDAATTLFVSVGTAMSVLDVCSEADRFVAACEGALRSMNVALETIMSARKGNAAMLFDTTEGGTAASPPPLHACLYSADDLFVVDVTVVLMMLARQATQIQALLESPQHHDRVTQLCAAQLADSAHPGQSIAHLLRGCTSLVPSLCAAATLQAQTGSALDGLSTADAATKTQQLQRSISKVVDLVRPFFATFQAPGSPSKHKGIWAAMASAVVSDTTLHPVMETLFRCVSNGTELVSQLCEHPLLAGLDIAKNDDMRGLLSELQTILSKTSASLTGSGSEAVLESVSVAGAASCFLMCSSVSSFGDMLEKAHFDVEAGLFPTLEASLRSRLTGTVPIAQQALASFVNCSGAFTLRVLAEGGEGWSAAKSPLMEVLAGAVQEAHNATHSTGYLSADAGSSALAGVLLAAVCEGEKDAHSAPEGSDVTFRELSELLVWMGRLHPKHGGASKNSGAQSNDIAQASATRVAGLFALSSMRRDVGLAMSRPSVPQQVSTSDEGSAQLGGIARVAKHCRETLLRSLLFEEEPSKTFLFGALSGRAPTSGDEPLDPLHSAAAGVSAAALAALEDERAALQDQVKKLNVQLWESTSEQVVFKQIQKELEGTRHALETTEDRHRREKAKLEEFMEVEMTKLASSKAALQSELRMLRTEAKLSPLSAAERRSQKLALTYYSELVAGALLGGETGLAGVVPHSELVAAPGPVRSTPSPSEEEGAQEEAPASVLSEAKRRTAMRMRRAQEASLRAIQRYSMPFKKEPATEIGAGDSTIEVVASAAPLIQQRNTFNFAADVERVLLSLHRSSQPIDAGTDVVTAKKGPTAISSLPTVLRFTSGTQCAKARAALLASRK